MNWKILHDLKNDKTDLTTNKILKILLENRGIKTKKEVDNFLNPKITDVTIESVGIDKKNLKKSLLRIKKAIKNKEKIIVYGDYDVDGICGTAILWETLFKLGANVDPYIPHRVEEGYGLSKTGIENLTKNGKEKISLIITVDNGIVANDAVLFANSHEIDVIITDHHALAETLPKAHSIVHTTDICGASVAWLFAREIASSFLTSRNDSDDKYQFLDLITLATIADLVPLKNANRAIVANGLEFVRKTFRVGLQALYQEARIDPSKIGVYEIGHIICPRLNAMGRLESAMDSLRLICTKNLKRAQNLALILGQTNKERQLLTQTSSLRAIEKMKGNRTKIIFIEDDFEEGVIGLIAGKLVETFYRPAIVISKKEKISKASARSITGFNIIEFIRKSKSLLINAGGHPMAAGFTVETLKIEFLKKQMLDLAVTQISDLILEKVLNIDLEIPLTFVKLDFYNQIQKLAPFGMKNPEPIFLSKGVAVSNLRFLGKEKKHVKLEIVSDNKASSQIENKTLIEAIAFNMADKFENININDVINIVFILDKNIWNGKENLQLKIKDVQKIN